MCSEASAPTAPPPPPPSPPLLRVVSDIPGRGRALLAARAIRPGEVLLVDSPVLLYPALDLPSSSSCSAFCARCYRSLPGAAAPLFPCPGCSGQALFCSGACRAIAASSSHTPWACHALSALRAAVPLPPPLDHPDVLSQAAFLVAAYNLASLRPDDFLRLLSLQGDAGHHLTSPEHALALHSLLSSLSPPAGLSPDLTAALLAKDKMNAFALMEPATTTAGGGRAGERRVRAYGIYPDASFFNHDCLPNACRFDYLDGDDSGDRSTDIVVRAIHGVPEGREVCLSYFPVNWSYRERQRRLLEDYGFSCRCDRCNVEKDWKDEEAEVEAMDEEEEVEDGDGGGDEGMEGPEEGEDGDFPHAYFFVRYMCQRENCGGTLAPLPPSPLGVVSDVMECNVCGHLSKGDDADGGWCEGDGGGMVDE